MSGKSSDSIRVRMATLVETSLSGTTEETVNICEGFLLLFFIFLVFSPWAFMGSEVLSGDQSLNTFSYKWIRLSGAISFSSRSAWHGDLDVNDWKWKLIKQTCPQGRQLCFVHSWRTPCWSAVPEASPCSLSMSDVSSLGKNKKCTLCIRCK